ncbi:hypothetical protein [Thalassobacillus devorans]|uniref:hypothetical protein n=1 Tax=Thalassobacillus devorans TaxID=279813 RepID=UPI0004BC0D0D|nr:hypothetical protein [Thalassobacillus devorans]
MRNLWSYSSLFLLFLVLFFYFTSTNDHLHSSGHPAVEIPEGVEVPEVKVSVDQLADGSWLLQVDKKNFTFTPELAGSSVIDFQKGHGHIYINGVKINRLYGEYYNLELPKGNNAVKVALVLNNHQRILYQDDEISDQVEVHVSS